MDKWSHKEGPETDSHIGGQSLLRVPRWLSGKGLLGIGARAVDSTCKPQWTKTTWN
jgi:hypothetical protein